MLKRIDSTRECITTPQASKKSGLSKSHLTRLLKSGALDGVQLGREWLVYTDSLENYMATPHKPGPKGPIKRDGKSREEETQEAGDAGKNES
jgi:excisionase family DNA binding protein